MQELRSLHADVCEHAMVQQSRNHGQHHLIDSSHQDSTDPTTLFLKIISPLKLLTVLPNSRSFLRTPAFHRRHDPAFGNLWKYPSSNFHCLSFSLTAESFWSLFYIMNPKEEGAASELCSATRCAVSVTKYFQFYYK